MSTNPRLTQEQEEIQLSGLRILARIVARHYLSNPELYPVPEGNGGPDNSSGMENSKEEDPP